ncbi:MAG TPA: hypothetical protein VGA18_05980 [Rhodothermales bacterium]|jgi:hypothetical protein
MSLIGTLKKIAGVFNILAPFISIWSGGKVNVADAAVPIGERLEAVKIVLKEAQEFVAALEAAIAPDSDGIVRITEAELDRIIDEAADFPAAIAALRGVSGTG